MELGLHEQDNGDHLVDAHEIDAAQASREPADGGHGDEATPTPS